MREPTIQFGDEPMARAFMPIIEEDEVEGGGAFTWASGRMAMALAPEHEYQPHLLEADHVVRLIVRPADDEDDVEGHTLTLRFPTSDEAARFRTKVLAGGLLVGSMISPAAFVAAEAMTSSQAVIAPAAEARAAAPITGPAAAPSLAAPVVAPGIDPKSGEDARTGSWIIWITQADDAREAK
jgi:hypothetical protein